MPKTTRIDTARGEQRKAAIESLKKRPLEDEKSVANLRERTALLEEIIGV